ncbi:hypothetical protein FJTKL_00126 [Diaporthe vaccinii]|uniref:Uncharacterized protein n=1 Tax=Diaporthe vaccinii TaxID=105482 RepID=A0ABR4E4E9_9PEZI
MSITRSKARSRSYSQSEEPALLYRIVIISQPALADGGIRKPPPASSSIAFHSSFSYLTTLSRSTTLRNTRTINERRRTREGLTDMGVVLLGVTPTTLTVLGAGASELGMVSVVDLRLFLSLLLTFDPPRVFVSHFFEYSDSVELRRNRPAIFEEDVSHRS